MYLLPYSHNLCKFTTMIFSFFVSDPKKIYDEGNDQCSCVISQCYKFWKCNFLKLNNTRDTEDKIEFKSNVTMVYDFYWTFNFSLLCYEYASAKSCFYPIQNLNHRWQLLFHFDLNIYAFDFFTTPLYIHISYQYFIDDIFYSRNDLWPISDQIFEKVNRVEKYLEILRIRIFYFAFSS